MKIIALTSCPVGMAHTYMAAAALKKAAKKLGHEIKVETRITSYNVCYTKLLRNRAIC